MYRYLYKEEPSGTTAGNVHIASADMVGPAEWGEFKMRVCRNEEG
jgi:hypothetical protein